MAKFRKKPVVIDAVPVREVIAGDRFTWPSWIADAVHDGSMVVSHVGYGDVTISTLEGELRGAADDMIIRGVKGELYPCKPDIFAATYDPVEETP